MGCGCGKNRKTRTLKQNNATQLPQQSSPPVRPKQLVRIKRRPIRVPKK